MPPGQTEPSRAFIASSTAWIRPSLADVELPVGILQNIDPKHGGQAAPEVGFEPTTNRLIPASRDSTTELLGKSEQLESDGLGRLPALDLTFPGHR